MSISTNGPVMFACGLVAGAASGIFGTILFFKKKDNNKNKELVDENNALHEKVEHLEEALSGAVKNMGSLNDEVKTTRKSLNEANNALKENRDVYSMEEYNRLYSGEDSHEVRDYTRFSMKQRSVNVDPAECESPSETDGDEYLDRDEEEDDERAGLIADGNLETEENTNYIRGEEMSKEVAYVPGRRPKLISAESFDNEYAHFDKKQLYYYVGDEVLATEEEEVIENIDQVIGDALDKYNFRENDESTIYVRNIDFSTDYEIEKVYSRFSDLM